MSVNQGVSARRHLVLAAIAVAGLFAVALAIDLPLQRIADGGRPPGVVRDYFKATETFGNGWGVAMIVVTIVMLDRARRVQTSRLLTASLGAGIMADVVKLVVSRTRPHGVELAEATVFDTFAGWMPLASAGSVGQSFPSAHTATAAGLAVALTAAYPAGARLFACFAAGVAMQRIAVGAHFASDVIAGGALGSLWAYGCCYRSAMCRSFDRVEAWWAERFGWTTPPPKTAGAAEPDVLAMPQHAESPAAAEGPLSRAA